MQSVVGIFRARSSAEEAITDLVNHGVAQKEIIFLTPDSRYSRGNTDEPDAGATEEKLEKIPTTDAEADGMGRSVGALMGGGIGATAGWAGGAALASMLIPGVGTIFAVGLGAAAVLGLGGAAAGAKVGDVAEHALDTGVPKDDVLFYRELLKQGWSVVVANIEDEGVAKSAGSVMRRQGAENVDDLRKQLRPAA